MRLVVFLALGLLLLPTGARAQTAAELATARELFQQGLDAAHSEDWLAARTAFEQSYAVAARPSTLLNLAGAQVQTGQLVEGAESYREFLRIATSGREATRRDEAQSALTAVEDRIAHVTIAADGVAPSDIVRIDDHIVSAAMLGIAAPMNPGPHSVSISRDDQVVGEQHFNVMERATVTIEVPVTAPIRVAAEDAADESSSAERAIASPIEPAHGSDDGVWIGLGIGIGAAVVAGVVIGVVFATSSSQPTYYQGNFGNGQLRF